MKANLALVDCSTTCRSARARRPRRSRSPGCSHRSPGSSPFPARPKLHRLEENLGAAAIELTDADLAAIEAAAAKIDLKGERLPEAALKMTADSKRRVG